MLKNYLKIAFRNLLNRKVASVINIIGLGIGIAAFIFIYLFIQDELSYDKQWADSERIFRISESVDFGDGFSDFAVSPFALGPSLEESFPEVVESARISHPSSPVTVSYDEKIFNVDNISYSENSFFNLFDFEFVQGDKATALTEPNTVVISEEVARFFFGKEWAIGKMLELPSGEFEVVGVIRTSDVISHLAPNALLSIPTLTEEQVERFTRDWTRLWCYTYLKLDAQASVHSFHEKLGQWHQKHIVPWIEEHELTYKISFETQPLEDIHFTTHLDYDFSSNTDKKYVYIFGYISILIIILACINYINLATAQSLKRSKEVGVRKVVGAERSQLIRQFLGESILVSFIALIVALMLVEMFLPQFSRFLQKDLSLFNNVAGANVNIWLIIIGLVFVIGLVSGSFPALILSSFKPIDVLKGGGLKLRGQRKNNVSSALRKVLVVFQFSISIGMIIATLVIFSQMRFWQNKQLGFDKEQIMVIEFPLDTTLVKKVPAIKDELMRHSHVKHVAATNNLPGYHHGRLTFYIGDSARYVQKMINIFVVDHDFADVLGIDMAEGRFFSEDYPSDPQTAFVVNEAAQKHFNNQAVNTPMMCGLGVDGHIVGVIKNFHYASLHNEIEPLILLYMPESVRRLAIKIDAENMEETISFIEKKWKEFDSKRPIEYAFLDENFDQQYRREQKMLTIFTNFSIFTVIISCLGLFGLATFMAEQRQKEIGVRKVLGATSESIVVLLSKDFTKLIVIASIIAIPVAYLWMNRWLQDFAYHVSISWYIYLIATLTALLIALFTVSYKAMKSANRNPIESLRYE